MLEFVLLAAAPLLLWSPPELLRGPQPVPAHASGAGRSQQEPPHAITSVDTYGLRTLSTESVRAASGLAVGEELREPVAAIEERLRALPGVADARVTPIVSPGHFALFVGIREVGSPTPAYRNVPTEERRLPPAIVAAYDTHTALLLDAIRAGETGADHALGHVLSDFAPRREVEEQFVAAANQHFPALAAVLRSSRHAQERAAAAAVIAYAGDKARVAPLLSVGARDPDASVRNNALRALGVLAAYAGEHPELGIAIDPDPFLSLLGSLEWTDRNKGAALFDALTRSDAPTLGDALTRGRGLELYERLRSERLIELAEMARWQSTGHAAFSIRVLGRLAGLSEDAILGGLNAEPRERGSWITELVIAAATGPAEDAEDPESGASRER